MRERNWKQMKGTRWNLKIREKKEVRAVIRNWNNNQCGHLLTSMRQLGPNESIKKTKIISKTTGRDEEADEAVF